MRVICTVFLLILSSCNFKPYYDRPCMEMPEGWRFNTDCPLSECANIRWWEQFQDPVLDELILLALQNNQDLLLATARVLEFYSKYRIVASQLFPEIDLEADYLRQELSNALNFSPLLPGTRYNSVYSIALSLSYEIDFWGKIRDATEAAGAEFVAQIEDRRTVILSLVSTLASAYVVLRQYDSQLLISKATYESRKEYWELAVLRFEGGLVSEMEVKQAEAEMQEAEVQVRQFEQLIPQQEDLICVLIGVPSTSIPRGSLLEELKQPPCVPAGLPSDLLENRPDILSAELHMIAANAEIGVARAAFFPAISLTGLYGFQSTSLHDLFKNNALTWNYGLSALEPLFTGWRLTYQLREAEAIKLETIHAYQQTILTAFQEVNDSLIAHQITQQIVQILKKQVAAYEVYLRLAFLRYENGQNDYLTVLDAQRRLFESQLDLAAARGNVFLSLISLYKALGGGWVIDADECLTMSQCG